MLRRAFSYMTYAASYMQSTRLFIGMELPTTESFQEEGSWRLYPGCGAMEIGNYKHYTPTKKLLALF
jgi:hypothetical protein